MSAEWQARQLLLMASAAAPPGNTRSPAGRSTVTDLNTGAAWARADRGESATTIDRPSASILFSISPPSSGHGNGGCFNDVAHEARRVPVCRVRLRDAVAVGAANHE